jgi:hypothetical protein
MDESIAGAAIASPLALRHRSPLAFVLAGLLHSGTATAQLQTTSESWGSMTSTDSVQGEITVTNSYLAIVTPQLNGSQVASMPNWFDYYDPRYSSQGQTLFAQFLEANGPAPMTADVNGVPVEVLSWADPLLIESNEEFIDANYFYNYYTIESEGVTVQLTSGDAPNREVYVGDRGECYSTGASGPTNYGALTGYFPDCMELNYIEAAPGTINTNTHTIHYTTIVEELVGNEDWQYQLYYNLTPGASASSSTAIQTQEASASEIRRVDDHVVQFRGEVGGAPSFTQDFGGHFNDDAVQAGLAALTRTHDGNPQAEGAPIVLAWSEPVLIDSAASLSGQQVALETSTRNSTPVTAQVSTRGLNEGDVVVNIGAGVDYALSPGETHTHTLTTQLTERLTTLITTENWRNTATYLLTPRATATRSTGHLTHDSTATDFRRRDSAATQLLGVVNGTTLFDRSLAGRIADPPVQASLAALAQPTGYALDGVPILVEWSAPQFLRSTERLLDRQVATQTSTRNATIVTTQTSIRGQNDAAVVVPYGDRGTCTDSGTDGLTTGDAPEGRLAACVGGTGYALSPGETNTNTHTTQVTEHLTTTVTSENWLNTSAYQLNGTAVPIGLSHAAVSDVLFDDGDFAGRQRTVLGSALNAAGEPSGLTPWFMLHASEANRDANDAGLGHRRTTEGISGGVAFGLGNGARAGVALDHSNNALDVDGQPEDNRIELLRLGAGLVLLMPADWQLDLLAGHGWSDIETERSGAANGGLSRADYTAGLWFSSFRLGPQLTLNRSLLRPFAEINWTRANLDAFTENGGGVALVGHEENLSRTELVAGAQFDLGWDLQSGARFGVTAELLGGAVVDGRQRERTVAFIATPNELLRSSSAEENSGFARGRLGLSFGTAEGFTFHLGMDGKLAEDQDSWRANAGVSVSF